MKNFDELYREWAGNEHTQDIERNIYDSAQMQDFAEYCTAELREDLAEKQAQIIQQLAEARAEVEHWKGECGDLVRMAHEMRAEIDYFQTLIDLQHKRTMEADKLWQIAHNQPNVWPDLGMLVEWLMKRADDMRCCYNCKYGPMCSVDARVCSGCSFAHNNPADGQMRWETKL